MAHTAFRAQIATDVVDLRRMPFSRDSAHWLHPADYTTTQAFGRVVREAGVGGIVYRSVRDPEASWCLALLTADGFARPAPFGASQTWWLMVSPDAVVWRRDGEAFTFATDFWAQQLAGG